MRVTPSFRLRRILPKKHNHTKIAQILAFYAQMSHTAAVDAGHVHRTSAGHVQCYQCGLSRRTVHPSHDLCPSARRGSDDVCQRERLSSRDMMLSQTLPVIRGANQCALRNRHVSTACAETAHAVLTPRQRRMALRKLFSCTERHGSMQ